MIKTVVSDLDGTLLGSKKDFPQINIEAIKELKKLNVKFGIATGRKIAAILELLSEWKIDGLVDFFVGENGAEIMYEGVQEQVFVLENHLIKEIIDEYDAVFNVRFGVYIGKDFVCNKVDEIVNEPLQDHGIDIFENDFWSAENNLGKLLMLVKPEDMQAILEYAKNHPSNNYRCFQSSPYMIEFVVPECSKSIGLTEVLKKFNHTLDNCISFGDATNDAEMIRDCKIGCVIEHGTKEAKDVADYIIGSNSDGAVGQTIFKFIEEGIITEVK